VTRGQGAPAGTALRRICDRELWLSGRGINFPAGGSLLLNANPAMSDLPEDSRQIPFNRPYTTGRELAAIADAISRGHIAADGAYSRRCRAQLQEMLGVSEALVVHSGTAALELSALLLDVGPGDEVIMPSYTFVTTATAFALRGATPVFVDIRPDTMNLDEALVEAAITERTRAIVAVHYAGVACEMGALAALADAHSLALVEDAAQGICASYEGRPLGTIGALGAISFHETKNVTCGNGGALIVNDERYFERAEVLRDKGTNRSSFVRGEVDRYTWIDLGSSYAISDLAAAFLLPQLEQSASITRERLALWNAYQDAFATAEREELLRRPVVPEGVQGNAHMYYLLLSSNTARQQMIEQLDARGISAVFHYVPLHSSPAGRRYGRVHGRLSVTEELSGRLVRLPLWTGMSDATLERVVAAVSEILAASSPRARIGRSGSKHLPPRELQTLPGAHHVGS
jgi:dTDP-4-amino-4,6-dideoxygalactose transaminase